jgi:AcrR family transcriptional regulator
MQANGVANTSLDSVLAASETSKSQLYHYFADKDALVLAVIQRQTECVLATAGASPEELTSIAALRRWRDGVVEHTRERHGAGGCPLGSLVSELAESPQSRALLSEGFARWEAHFVARLEAIRARSKHKSRANLKDLAMTLLTALQGGLLLAQAMRSTRPLELALDAAIDHIAHELT